ncbi:hypothetical protein R1sor_021901 [Riccia sorocarpa]|uniref:Uncharacterized protein n=1 Tax=Riccia sorocarpa TaxID=122646 RepID=A0ABD3GIB3_9MARC
MQRHDSTGKASKASASRNNSDICRAPIASSHIRLASLQKSLGRKATTASQVKHLPASQHPGDASAHATTFESKDSDQGSEDFSDRETMQRPDSTGKASKANARRNNTDISRASSASSPIRPAPLQKSLGRKPTPASQDLPQMLSDESYSTIALVILGCKTKADIGNKIGKYATDFKILSHRKAFNNKPFDEKIRMVVEDSIRRNLVSLQGKAARQEGKLILERANVKFTAHLAF